MKGLIFPFDKKWPDGDSFILISGSILLASIILKRAVYGLYLYIFYSYSIEYFEIFILTLSSFIILDSLLVMKRIIGDSSIIYVNIWWFFYHLFEYLII